MVRAGQNRVLIAPDGTQRVGSLHKTVRQAPALGQCTLDLSHVLAKAARTATLSINAHAVRLRARSAPVPVPVSYPPLPVRRYEPEATPPQGNPPLEWILLCDAPATTFARAHECMLHYASRWLVEDFRKALKTGLGVEKLQFEKAQRKLPGFG